jgi:hypothetical protein
MTSTPSNNDRAFAPHEEAYIRATTREFDRCLQHAGCAWPDQDIQALLTRHWELLRQRQETEP